MKVNLFQIKECNSTNIFRIIIALFLVAFFACASDDETQTPRRKMVNINSLKPVIAKVTNKYHRSIRVAVFDFTNAAGRRTPYGAYVATVVIHHLSSSGKLRLLERKRLKTLLAEQALEKSGIISSGDIKKIGKVLPVDVIVTGTYVPESRRRIRVRGRFIDVVTGEIQGVFVFYIKKKISKDIKVDTKKIITECHSIHEPIISGLGDLRSQSKVKVIVRRSILIPFDLKCGKIHYRIIRTFRRNNLHPDVYKKFLMAVVRNIKEPFLKDGRTLIILRYLASDGKVDEEEWKTGLHSIKNSKYRGSRIFLKIMLNNRKAPDALMRKRIDEIMGMARNGEIGRPRIITDSRAILMLLYALGIFKDPRSSNHLYTLRKYANFSQYDRREMGQLFNYMEKFYLAATNPELRTGFRDQIIKFYLSGKRTERKIEWLWGLLREAERFSGKASRKDVNRKKQIRLDISVYNKKLRNLICNSTRKTRKKNLIKERMEYALRYGMNCPGIITVQALIAVLRSTTENINRKREAAEMLSRMGVYARPAESIARDYLGNGHRGRGSRFGKIRTFLVRMMGNLKTRDRRSIIRLLETLAFRGYLMKHVKTALLKIGPTALPYMLNYAENRRNIRHARFRVIYILGDFGRKAKHFLPRLKRFQRRDKDRAIRHAVHRTIKLIDQDEL